MHVTSLEIILAVIAVFVVFGPKELPGRKKQPQTARAVKVERERVPIRPLQPIAASPSQFAAGRAPSPLQLRAAERPMNREPQFAHGDKDGSPLPHELLRV
jgi:hypothetical protein